MAKAKNVLVKDFFMWLNFMNHNLKFFHTIHYDLTVKVVPVMSTDNFVKPFVAGPCTKDPLELNDDPWAAQKKEDVELLYSTVAPA